MSKVDQAYDYLLQFFAYEHLPPHLQAVSKQFHDLAHAMVVTLPANPERSAGLRRLLEAKDCAVRAVIFKWKEPDAG
jgi:ferritin-like protein